MWRQTVAALFGVVVIMGAVAAPALAYGPRDGATAAGPVATEVRPEAEPEEDQDPDRPPGYYIWHNEDGWHLRTHGPRVRHHFTARLQTDGTFVNLSGVRLEAPDNYVVTNGGHTLSLDFMTYGGWDGVDFRIADGNCIRFRLELNSELVSPRMIYLGEAHERHPEDNPFGLCRTVE